MGPACRSFDPRPLVQAAAAARERSLQLQQRSEAKAAAEADVEAEKRAVRERAEATARSLRERMAARTAEFTSSGSNAAASRAAREVGRRERASFDPGEKQPGCVCALLSLPPH